MDELYHQYKSLSNVYKGYIARTAWDGVNYKEEWLRKSQIIPEKYSEVEVLKVTDYLRHRDFLKRRREREWRENLPIAPAMDTAVEQDVRDEIDSVFIVRQEEYQKLVNDYFFKFSWLIIF